MVKIREEQLGSINLLDEDGYGIINANNAIISNVSTPIENNNAANKEYVDNTHSTLSEILNNNNDVDGYDILNINLITANDGYFLNDLEVSGKLTVGGLIDPTGIILTNQNLVPNGIPDQGKTIIWTNNDGYLIVSNEFGEQFTINSNSFKNPQISENGYVAIAYNGDLIFVNGQNDGYVLTWNVSENTWESKKTYIPNIEEILTSGDNGNQLDIININNIICNNIYSDDGYILQINSNDGYFENNLIVRNIDIPSTYNILKNPSGFPNRTDSSISIDDDGYIFTISPVADSFDFYIKGVKYTKTTPQTVSWTNVEGIHFFYFNTSGTLTHTTSDDDFISIIKGDGATVAAIYWDYINTTTILLGEERHGFMDPITHSYLHSAFGAQWISGGQLTNIIADGSGALNSHAQFGLTTISIADEDIVFNYTDGVPQEFDPIAYIPIYYQLGPVQTWRMKTADAFPFIQSGSAGYTNVNGLPAYNLDTGGTWSLAPITNNDFFLCHYYAGNDLNKPIFGVLGQNLYGSVGDARTGAEVELHSIGTILRSLSKEFTPLGTVIFQGSTGYGNDPGVRIRSTTEGLDYIDFRGNPLSSTGASSGGVTDHGNLTGLTDVADHPGYLTLNGTRTMVGPLLLGSQDITGVDGITAVDGYFSNITSIDGYFNIITSADGYFNRLTLPVNNIAIGTEACVASTIAGLVGIGYRASKLSTVTSVGIGYQALSSNTTGTFNTAIGYQSLQTNSTGAGNTAIGHGAGILSTSNYNTLIGYNSGGLLSSGYETTAVGYSALSKVTTGLKNTAIGYGAGTNLTSSYNTLIGHSAGFLLDGGGATAIGYASLSKVTSGIENTAIGYGAGTNLTSSYNTLTGHSSGGSLQTGEKNTANGNNSLFYLTTGSRNTAVGFKSGYFIHDGYDNVSVGYTSLYNTTNSSNKISNNTVVGSFAGGNVISDGNTLIGFQAGDALTDGYNNTAIGYNAFGSTTSYFNSTCIGANSIVSGSCQIQLGDSTTTTYIYGAIQDRSDIRDKTDIRDTILGIEFIKKLRPVDFKWDYREDYSKEQKKDGSKKRTRYHHGLIAQEVKKTCDELGLDFGGYQNHTISGGKDINTLGYSEFISILIKSIQEQQVIIEKLEERVSKIEKI